MTQLYQVQTDVSENGAKPKPRPRQARLELAVIGQSLLDDGWRFAQGGGELYVYEGGVYVPAKIPIRRELCRRLKNKWRPDRANGVIQWLYDTAPALWEVPPATYINVANCLVNRETGDPEPHSPEFLSPIQLPVNYDLHATCPNIDRVLSEIFPLDSSILGYEYAGWLCTGDTWIRKALLLCGDGGNGKSTLCKLWRSLIGEHNVCSVSLQQLGNHRFATADLYGKLANIYADLPGQRVEDTSIFKILTGDDGLLAGEIKYGQRFQFRPFARLVFSANEIPGSSDQTKAYIERWMVIPFQNHFTDSPNFLDALTTPEEMSGLFNRALTAYEDVLYRQQFTGSIATAEGTRLLEESVSPVLGFLNECTDSGGYRTDRTDLYHSFRGWLLENGNKPWSAKRFNSQVRQHYGEVTVRGSRCWNGLTLNGDGQKTLEHFDRWQANH